EVWRKQNTFPSKKAGEEFSIREQNPLAFIYQDDRVTLHARNEDSEKEKNSFYRSIYRSSIDERFEYLRDAIQVQESLYYKQLAGVFSKINEKIKFDDVIQSPEYASVTEKIEEIENVVLKLNSYFEMSGKQVMRDENNKYTLALINEDPEDEEYKPISWNLLSRGEKTLLYLFFAVYYYKDKVNVFLLDEPDISLHVSWQENLISDLLSIAPNNQFIVATHSPSLVMNGWMDNCLDLKV
ncbi:ATP-binding protein, partial [Vibrio alginolyticus]|nr:ATP-binding protein [Vibrio alginolyticus]